MSQDTADIVGSKGAKFTITVATASIAPNGATLIVSGQPDQSLSVSATGQFVTVPSLPSGDSTVSLALVWPPGQTQDAAVGVGTVTTGTATAADPPPFIDSGRTPGFVALFGVGQ
jgi:hypothetical protein